MSNLPRRVLVVVLVAIGAIGVSASLRQTTPPAAATSRAVAAANAFLATLDDAQRQKANLEFNEKTRVVWSNLPSGTTMQVGRYRAERPQAREYDAGAGERPRSRSSRPS